MPDIVDLILDDHDWFRRQFSALDGATGTDELHAIWKPLADLLDVHAAAEEEIFYPELLHLGKDDPEDETIDAIGDHNDIRDGVADAARHPVGTDAWFEAVWRARVANSEHMAEEEDEGLADFRKHADPKLRGELGQRFLEFKEKHKGRKGIDTGDVDPHEYVRAVEHPAPAWSLGIGGLKGRG